MCSFHASIPVSFKRLQTPAQAAAGFFFAVGAKVPDARNAK